MSLIPKTVCFWEGLRIIYTMPFIEWEIKILKGNIPSSKSDIFALLIYVSHELCWI